MTRTTGGGSAGRPRGWRIAAGVAAVLVLHVALALPNHLDRITPAAFLRLPVEAAVLLGLLAFTVGRAGRIAEAVVGVAVALALVLKIADVAMYEALARPFNPVLDVHLIDAAMNLMTGAVGRAGALAGAAAAAVAALLVGVAVVFAVRGAGRVVRLMPRRVAVGLSAALLAAWGGLWAGGLAVAPRLPAAAMESARSVATHAEEAVASLADLRRFREEAAVDAYAGTPPDRLFTALRGKDVLVVFVESYGRTVFDDPRYAPPFGAFVEEGAARLAAAGVSARSGWLTAPTVGGMSWLSHGTLLSGLWVDNQRRYQSLVGSDRMTLNAAFRNAGWRTVALMPAITMAWPEGQFYGYDRIYDARGLGYRGQPFNWVTMPDQYVWSALRAFELDLPDRPPVMAELALISSHAPWTPVPRLVPWDEVGDGSVFDAMAAEGDPPDVVWRDPDRVRRQFRECVEYALETVVSYVETFGLDDTVLVVLGDHQPAPMITGEGASRDVPVHILSDDPAVLAAIEDWGWTDGLRPAGDLPAWRMDAFRDRFIRSFSPGMAMLAQAD